MDQENRKESDVPRRSILNLTRSEQEETTDDNSSDNSLDVIKQFSNIKIIENKIQTKFGSLNQLNAFKKAVEISKGDLIFLLDSDDYFKKDKIEKVVNYFLENKNRKIVFDFPIIIKENNHLIIKKKK